MAAEIGVDLKEFVVANYLFGDLSRMPADDESLVEGGVIDSTGILELIEFLESRFGIEVTEEETVPDNLGSVTNLIRFVTGKRAVGEPSS